MHHREEHIISVESKNKSTSLAMDKERERQCALQRERDSEFIKMQDMLRSVTAELKLSQGSSRSNIDGLETDSEGGQSRVNRRTSSGGEEDVWTSRDYSPTELNPDLLSSLKEESLFYQTQLSIARNTLSEYSENILRQGEELASFKLKEEAMARSLSNEIGPDSFKEMETLGIPILNMKDVLRSRPLLQSRLLAQFQSILDEKSRISDLQVASLSERLQW